MSGAVRLSPMSKNILVLAVPAIFNNITVPLLGLSDTAITGHLGSASYLAAMAVGTMMLNVIFWLCGFLRMGTTGLSSHAFGAGNFNLTIAILNKALKIGLIISCVVLILQRPLEQLLFLIISPEEKVSELASLYFRICLWGAPAQLVIIAVSGWFIGLQNTVIPMIIAVGVNVVNILLSILLVFVFETGFAGVAIGTLSANWLGMIASVIFVRRRINSERRKETAKSGNSTQIKIQKSEKIKNSEFLKVNINLFFRSACIMIVTLAMTSYGSRLGETTLAANTVIMQFFLFFSYFMDGFAFAGEAIVGSSFGARNFNQLRKCVGCLLIWGACIAISFTIIYVLASGEIICLLTNNYSVVLSVEQMKWWLVVMPAVTVLAFIFDGVFIGLAKTRILFVTTFIASLIFFLITTGADNISFVSLSNNLLWISFGCYLLARGVLLGVEYVKLQRKILSL